MSRAEDDANEHVEEVIILTGRLTALVEREIAAVKAQKPQELECLTTERNELSAHYGRAVARLKRDKDMAKTADPARRLELKRLTERFRQLLDELADALARIRRISEGLVRAIAEEVTSKRAQPVGYSKNAIAPAAYAKPPAIALNRVV